MGNEVNCTARFGKHESAGKALLETSEIIFRGEFRLKIPFSSIQSLEAADGELRVQTADGLVVFALGDAAAKWREKILHPKSRLEKLGVKPGGKVSLIGAFDEDFLQELARQTDVVVKGKVGAGSEWIFLAVGSKKELAQVPKFAKSVKGAGALWIVYPKGRKEITEVDVITAGRKAGLKDVKVVGFSQTHTALKFVVPLGKRRTTFMLRRRSSRTS
jgi:hypothetical protein